MEDTDKPKQQPVEELAEMQQQMSTQETLRSTDIVKLLKALADSSSIGIYLVQDGKFLFANYMFRKYVGYSREELVGMDSLSLVHPEDRDTVRENAIKMLKGERFSPYEFRYVNKRGETLWVMEAVNSVQYQGREAVLGSFIDTTQQKAVEEKYQQLVDNMNDGYVVIDEEKIVFTNTRFAEIFGYDPEQVIGMSIIQFIAPVDLQSAVEQYKRVLRGEEVAPERRESLGIRKDGTTIAVESNSKAIEFEGQSAFTVIVRDITERRQAEENYRQLLEDMSDGYGVIQNGKYVFTNSKFCEIFGYEPGELIGKSLGDFVPPEERQAVMERHAREIRGEEAVPGRHEAIVKKRDGTAITIETNRKLITYAGKPGIATIIRDITELKFAADREKQLQQELITASRLATIGEMAAGIAHEINNPLTGVVGFTGLLLKKDIPEDMKDHLNNIYEGARRISDITNRMLTFSRKQNQEMFPIDINTILETTLAMRSHEMSINSIEVQTDLAPNLPMTVVDAGQIQQVFLNIILNAEIEMKKAHQGGTLQIKTEEINNTIRISFKDDGPGISKKNLDKIFEPFFTTRETGEGAGLGLSVSYGIVMQHNGKIYVQSRPGKGANFVVELPVVCGAGHLKPAEPPAEDEEIGKFKVLAVDDEPIVQYLLSQTLDKYHEVDIVSNGNSAIEKLDQEDYDIILLDVRLPGMSGIELYEHILNKDKSLADKVIFITGDTMNKNTMTYIQNAGIPLVTKPFDSGQLTKTIGQVLSQRP